MYSQERDGQINMVISKLTEEAEVTKEKGDIDLQRRTRSIENKYEDSLRSARESEVHIFKNTLQYNNSTRQIFISPWEMMLLHLQVDTTKIMNSNYRRELHYTNGYPIH